MQNWTERKYSFKKNTYYALNPGGEKKLHCILCFSYYFFNQKKTIICSLLTCFLWSYMIYAKECPKVFLWVLPFYVLLFYTVMCYNMPCWLKYVVIYYKAILYFLNFCSVVKAIFWEKKIAWFFGGKLCFFTEIVLNEKKDMNYVDESWNVTPLTDSAQSLKWIFFLIKKYLIQRRIFLSKFRWYSTVNLYVSHVILCTTDKLRQTQRNPMKRPC